MYNEKMFALGNKRSVIRELFEYGKKMKQEVGADKVFDFSLGNPSIPAPYDVKDAINDLTNNFDSTQLHGYTSAQGDLSVRKTVADYINKRFDAKVTPDNIYMTVGAAASLTISLNALCCDGDEVIVLAPFFPEYRVFVSAAGGKSSVVPIKAPDFGLNIEGIICAINKNTKAIIVNSPNNPCGAVYSENDIIKLAELLENKEKEYGHPIYIIADEPYREIVYDGLTVPYLMNYYDDTIVCYSYSKSLSLPGERIGYIAVSPKSTDSKKIYLAVCGAGRALGFVCAPSLFQRVIAKCIDKTGDISAYKKNRDLLYENLVKFGFECVHPDGAFYLFVKAKGATDEFCERAKKLGLLLVPGGDFGAADYVRIAYCVSYDMIERSLPYFQKLAESYK